jgi:hypothetical protein
MYLMDHSNNDSHHTGSGYSQCPSNDISMEDSGLSKTARNTAIEPSFSRIPLHLWTIVLMNLDSMESLSAAIFAHSSFYNAFMEMRDQIIRAIITNQIPANLMAYARRTWRAASSSYKRSKVLKLGRFLHDAEFMFELAEPDICFQPLQLTPQIANSLSKTHSRVQYFTKQYIDTTLPKARRHLGVRRSCTGASEDEIFRIQRAIYRFQWYCNVLNYPFSGKERKLLGTGLGVWFFHPFSPWVNEQLACIHDYFERVLSEGMYELFPFDIAL